MGAKENIKITDVVEGDISRILDLSGASMPQKANSIWRTAFLEGKKRSDNLDQKVILYLEGQKKEIAQQKTQLASQKAALEKRKEEYGILDGQYQVMKNKYDTSCKTIEDNVRKLTHYEKRIENLVRGAATTRSSRDTHKKELAEKKEAYAKLDTLHTAALKEKGNYETEIVGLKKDVLRLQDEKIAQLADFETCLKSYMNNPSELANYMTGREDVAKRTI